jgi:putative ABC transport system permease protein
MDNFYKNKEDIYLLTMKSSPKSDWTSIRRFTEKEYPEVKNRTTLLNYKEDELKLKQGSNTYTPKGIVIDSSFFKVFNFTLNLGSIKGIAEDNEAIILSEAFSKSIFGDKNPIGQEVELKMRYYQGTRTVKGIIKIPSNSSLKFEYLLPKGSQKLAIRQFNRMGIDFIRVNDNFNKEEFNEKIKNINNNVPNFRPILTKSNTKAVNFQNLYLDKTYKSIVNRTHLNTGDKQNNNILKIIILVILLVSILNYSNLQIVNTHSVTKNIIISKVNGALKKHIFYQKMVETFIIIIISAFLITLFYNIISPTFNAFVKVNLAPPIWKILLVNSVILGVIAFLGLVYPMIVVHGFSDVKNLKQNHSSQKIKGKKIIVIAQYSLAFVLLISSIVIDRQLQLMLHKDLGFSSNNVVRAKLFYEPPFDRASRNWSDERRKEEREKFTKIPQYINNQLSSFSSVEKIAQGNFLLDPFTYDWKNKGNNSQLNSLHTLIITPSYLEMFDLEVTNGRFFDKIKDKPRQNLMMLNEAAIKYWNITDISATRILGRGWGGKEGYQIVGVVKDFNFQHLSAKPKPLMMLYWADPDEDYFIKLNKNKIQEGLTQIEKLFKEINPSQTFKYSFLSDEINALYLKEKRLSTIYMLFTIIALVISAIGLFTIALYDTRRRIKEIGIRKVNGATSAEIVIMLNKDFIKWVIIAFFVATPIAYYAMNNWLQNFAYKTTLSWWIFALVGLFIIIISLLTVSWQSYYAARNNPVDSLRDD